MKTVKVRIALMINADGKWSASGWAGAPDEHMRDTVNDCIDQEPNHDTLHWIEAEVPVPEIKSTTIKGKVKS